MIYWMVILLDPLCRTPKCHAMFWHLQLACLTARNFTCILNSSFWAISPNMFSLARRVTQQKRKVGAGGIDCLSVCTAKTAPNFRAIWRKVRQGKDTRPTWYIWGGKNVALCPLQWNLPCEVCSPRCLALLDAKSSVSMAPARRRMVWRALPSWDQMVLRRHWACDERKW